MAETKVLRAGALSCLANGERIALDNVLEAIFRILEWSWMFVKEFWEGFPYDSRASLKIEKLGD